MVPFAYPLADKAMDKLIASIVASAATAGALKRGVKEVVKAMRRGDGSLVVIAGDVSPMDVISHLPVLCEEAAVPFVFVDSKSNLGVYAGMRRPVSAVLLSTRVVGYDGGKHLRRVLGILAGINSLTESACIDAAAGGAMTDTSASRAISVDSTPFQTLRARGNAFVDKTGVIADLLMSDDGMYNRTRAFFSRPRKFGKSLTLDIAAEMLAAGELPVGVAPWPGYEQVDIAGLFGGLDVHTRLLADDETLRSLLKKAHFVVKLGLGGLQTGEELRAGLIALIAAEADRSFGNDLSFKVRTMATSAADALGMLINAVPVKVPIAVLLDEYDAPIIGDVTKGRWRAAETGIEALRSLMMTSKDPAIGGRINRFIVTGVARFAHTSLFSGANNFVDFTSEPLLSRVLGFSEDEIRDVFPTELTHLAARLGTSVDGAVSELERWYDGYCFDGLSRSFSPFPVLLSLRIGNIAQREMDAASGTNWLSLAPGALIERLALDFPSDLSAITTQFDIADLEAQRVHVVPLLLQTGLLSLVQSKPHKCRPPNEYARHSMQAMVATALKIQPAVITPFAAVLRDCNRTAFVSEVKLLFEKIPNSLFRRDSERVSLRESVFHAALFSALIATSPPGVDVQIQVAFNSGIADIVVTFPGSVWVLEIGVGGSASAKLRQPCLYSAAFRATELFCCAIVIAAARPSASVASSDVALCSFAWARRVINIDSKCTWEQIV